MAVRIDGEAQVTCLACKKPAILREMLLVEDGSARKVSYETHCESVIEPAHIAAQGRAEQFYKSVFALIKEFNALPESDKVIESENGGAGKLIELDIGSERPSACEVRTVIVPYFSLKTFGREHELKLEPRDLAATALVSLLDEVKLWAAPIIEEAKDRAASGL